MKKHFYAVAIAALAIVSSATAYDGVTWDKTWSNDSKTLTVATEAKAADWMADLPDNMFVAHVSIPGTHDSATGGNSVSMFSEAQDAELPEMMTRGIRAWDFRPGLRNGQAWCYHGTEATNTSFADAMKMLTDFLAAHPNEFFIIHLFKGNLGDSDTADQQTLNARINEIINTGDLAKYFVDFRPDLKVGDVRGQIVIFRRDRFYYVDLPKAAYIDGWHKGFENGNGLTVYNASDATKATQLVVQDWSDGSDAMDTKKTDCEALLNWSSSQITPNDGFKANGSYLPKWSMNFTSRGAWNSRYGTNAKEMNPFAINWLSTNLGKGPLGIIYSDYVLRSEYSGSELVYKIIENNFTGGSNAPVVRYAIDETLDWNSPTVYIRNVQTGLYLANGLWWGTHAVTDDCGLPVKLIKQSDGTIKIVSPLDGNNGKGLGDNDYIDNGSPATVQMNTVAGTNYVTFTLNGTSKRLRDQNWQDPNFGVPFTTHNAFFSDEATQFENEYNWEVLTLNDILNEASNGSTSGKEYLLSMAMREGHNYVLDHANIEGYWKNALTATNAYAQVWGVRGGGSNDNWFVVRLAHENEQTDDSFVYDRTIDNLPNGNYRVEAYIASCKYDAATLSGFSFTINGVEIKNQIKSTPSSVDFGTEGGAAYFKDNAANLKVSVNVKVTDGTLNLHCVKPHLGTAGSLFMDNWEIIYTGIDKTPIELTFPMYYNTMMLPFDVAEADMPENLKAFPAVGHEVKTKPLQENQGKDYSYHVINLGEKVADIKANTPYIIVNENGKQLQNDAPNAAKSRAAASEDPTVYTFTGYPNTSGENEYSLGILTGVHDATTVDAGHYVLTAHPLYQNFGKSEEVATVDAHRAYVNASAAEHPIIVFNDQDNVLTGVEAVGADADADAPVEYFNLQGQPVANPAAGIYIRRQGSKVEKVIMD